MALRKAKKNKLTRLSSCQDKHTRMIFKAFPECPRGVGLSSTQRANLYPEVSNPFSRLPLPTLFPMTRGCSPWGPDAVIGTLIPETMQDYRFSRSVTSALDTAEDAVLFWWVSAYLGVVPFQVDPNHYKEERTLPRADTGFPIACCVTTF